MVMVEELDVAAPDPAKVKVKIEPHEQDRVVSSRKVRIVLVA